MKPLLLAGAMVALGCACAGQRDVSLEALVRSAEGRVGLFAVNLESGQQLRMNADLTYPMGALRAMLAAEVATAGQEETLTRILSSPDVREEERLWRHAGEQLLTPLLLRNGPRGLENVAGAVDRGVPRISPALAGEAIARLLRAAGSTRSAIQRALITGDRVAGSPLSPTLEVGAAHTAVEGAPGMAGWVRTPNGAVVAAILTEGFRSDATAAAVIDAALDAAVRRLARGFAEAPADPGELRGGGLLLSSLHEAGQLRPAQADVIDGPGLVAERGGRQRFTFMPGETVRLSVIAQPRTETRLTAQWLLPDDGGCRRTRQVLLAPSACSETLFDLPVLSCGTYRVRLAIEDRIAFDAQFFVTRK